MTPTETITILRQFNARQRNLDDRVERPDPHEIGVAIDEAIAMIERTLELEIAMQEFAWGNDNESQTDCVRPVSEKSK